MAELDASLLRAIAPRVAGQKGKNQAAIIEAVGAVLSDTLAAYQINSAVRVAHFLAQVAHECDGFCTTQEYASGKAYEDRKDLGNTKPGDGVRYKGHGLIQLTGRFNHRKYGKLLGLDLERNPEIAAQPIISLKIACEYWKQNGLNAHADKEDIEKITRIINGGLNGFADRQAYLAKARAALGKGPIVFKSAPGGASAGSLPPQQTQPVAAAADAQPAAAVAPSPTASPGGGASVAVAPPPAPPPPVSAPKPAVGAPLDLAAVAVAGNPVLRRGAKGDQVIRLQQFLVEKGWPMVVDGDFGETTENAVIQFQQANSLEDDGVVGEGTWELLEL